MKITNNYYLVNHPLINEKMTILRNEETESDRFRKTVQEITTLLAFRVLENIKVAPKDVKTPINTYHGVKIDENVLIAPILRAGLSMVESMLALVSKAKVAHLGMYREADLSIKSYYVNLPSNLNNTLTIIVDPLLATGSSLIKAIDILKENGANRIIYVGLIGTEIGINKVLEKHPELKIYLAAIDNKLTNKGYIDPGLGDAGDRLYGTLKWLI